MTNQEIKKIIKQVIHNSQVTPPPISYIITDTTESEHKYKSNYIDEVDFKSYVKRLEKQLICRLIK